MEIARETAHRLLGDLLPKRNSKKWRENCEKYRANRKIQDAMIWHLQLARESYDAAQADKPKSKPATAKEIRKAITAVKNLRISLTGADLSGRVLATTTPNEIDELQRYVTALAPAREFQEAADAVLPLLDTLERHLIPSLQRLPNSSPDYPLRCAVAPLIALFRAHNPDAEFVIYNNRPNRAVRFVRDALNDIGIEASKHTLGKMKLAELPFYDW